MGQNEVPEYRDAGFGITAWGPACMAWYFRGADIFLHPLIDSGLHGSLLSYLLRHPSFFRSSITKDKTRSRGRGGWVGRRRAAHSTKVCAGPHHGREPACPSRPRVPVSPPGPVGVFTQLCHLKPLRPRAHAEHSQGIFFKCPNKTVVWEGQVCGYYLGGLWKWRKCCGSF